MFRGLLETSPLELMRSPRVLLQDLATSTLARDDHNVIYGETHYTKRVRTEQCEIFGVAYADYLYGKRRLNQIDSRIRFLTKRIDAAVVVDPTARRPASVATRAFFGATVTYKDAAGLEHVVSIVGIDEVDLDRGYISWRSPLGNALIKASAGDRVDLRAPAKAEHLEIIDVEYAPIPMDPFREPLGAQSKPKVERS